MRRKYLQWLFVQSVVILMYFVVTTLIYFVSRHLGSDGVSLRLFGGGDDGYFYWEQAKNVAAGRPAKLTSIYPLIIGYLVKFSGVQDVYVIRLFNFFGFAFLIAISYSLLNMVTDSLVGFSDPSIKYDARTYLLLLFLVYPSLQINANLSIYRDIWIYALFLLSTTLSARLIFWNSNRTLYLILLLLSLWLLGAFRNYALLSFLIAMAMHCVYSKLKRPVITIGILLFSLGFYYTFLIDYTVPIVNMSLRDVLAYRLSFIAEHPGGSQMWIRLDQPSFVSFLSSYIYSYVGNLLGPLAWQITGWSTLLVFFVETIPMLGVLWFLWKNRSVLSKVQRYVLSQGFVWIGFIAISNDNLGAATRLRAVGWIPILIVFVSVYCSRKATRGRPCWQSSVQEMAGKHALR